MSRRAARPAAKTAPTRSWSAPTGWCITAAHDACPVVIDHGANYLAETVCSCSCHGSTRKAADVEDPVPQQGPAQDA